MREEEEVEEEEKEEVVEEDEKGSIESHFPSNGKDSTEKVEDGQGLSTFYPPVPPNWKDACAGQASTANGSLCEDGNKPALLLTNHTQEGETKGFGNPQIYRVPCLCLFAVP